MKVQFLPKVYICITHAGMISFGL